MDLMDFYFLQTSYFSSFQGFAFRSLTQHLLYRSNLTTVVFKTILFVFFRMTSWDCLPAELLLKISSYCPDGAFGLNGVCNSWKNSLEENCTKAMFRGSALDLPQNLATCYPCLSALDLKKCKFVSASTLQNLQPLGLSSLGLSIDLDEFSDESIAALHALQNTQISMVLNVNAHIPLATFQTLKDLNLASLELSGSTFLGGSRMGFLNGPRDVSSRDFKHLPMAVLDINRADDCTLGALGNMPLTRLSFSNATITDAGIRHLRGLPLIHLDLRGCVGTD